MASQTLEKVLGFGTLRGTPAAIWEATMEAEALRLLIRSKLEDGRLPYNSMPRFWGGPGDGERCDACDTRITKEQLAMEGIASTHTDEKPIQFHVKCFYAWDAERRRAIAAPALALI
jgi:hypothetical protein